MKFKSTVSSQAFTLVEAMIAVFVVSISSLATLSLLAQMQSINAIEQQRARAHQIVSDQMERVRQQLYSMITAGQTITIWDNGTANDATDDTQGTLVVRITNPATGAVLAVAPNPARRVQVEVTLSWRPSGRLNSHILRESVMAYVAP